MTRQLPPPPSYLKPQPVPVVKKGDDAIVVIKERGNVIKRQNRIIVGAKKLWEKTKKTYSESVVKRRLFGQ